MIEYLIYFEKYFFSDTEADTDLTSDDNCGVVKKVGVRSFGIDDILSHSSGSSVKNGNVKKPGQGGRSPLDALFTMTTNFESLKQKSGNG